jgi:AAA+ ATPase superfamily predicted ATPase
MESRLGERPEFIYFVGGSPRSGLSTVVSRVLNDYAGNSYIVCLPLLE